ncbi:MAG: aminopeptidase [Treponema sp.]|jgi:predicted aminopeptidase|nr:aminopeptidase [Treponema sp.]
MLKNTLLHFQPLLPFSPVIAAAALLLAVCISCSGCYTLKQGSTMLGYLNRAIPLGQLSSENEADAEFVRLVQDIRYFAMEELGLKMSKNYTSYVQLDRGYLAAVVSASAPDSFTRHDWHFPVVGAMPYKGFFNAEDARKERTKLEKKGLDVWVRGVDAFSTLGWFKDPLYSYMRDYSPSRLADLLIHELLHATVFIKGQVKFNEELAEFIGSEGARLYVESRFGADSEEYKGMFASDTDGKKFVEFIRELIAELDALYKTALDREEKLKEKERIITAAKERFDSEYESRFSNDNYRGFSDLPVNNAYLELYRLYHAEDNFYAELYERSGRNLPAFVAAAKTVTKKNGNPRLQLEKALTAGYN